MGTNFGKPNATVLNPKLGGGPRGLGDPDDTSLRIVEKDVLISQLVRDAVRQDKCKEIGDAFEKCGAAAGLLLVFKCQKEKNDLIECSKRWFHDEELRKECTEEYLKRRSHYRRTGERGHLHRLHGSVYQGSE